MHISSVAKLETYDQSFKWLLEIHFNARFRAADAASSVSALTRWSRGMVHYRGGMPNTGDAYKQTGLSELLMKTFIIRKQTSLQWRKYQLQCPVIKNSGDIITQLAHRNISMLTYS